MYNSNLEVIEEEPASDEDSQITLIVHEDEYEDAVKTDYVSLCIIGIAIITSLIVGVLTIIKVYKE